MLRPPNPAERDEKEAVCAAGVLRERLACQRKKGTGTGDRKTCHDRRCRPSGIDSLCDTPLVAWSLHSEQKGWRIWRGNVGGILSRVSHISVANHPRREVSDRV